MLPRDSPHVLPLVLGEDLGGVPDVLSNLKRDLAQPKVKGPFLQEFQLEL